MTGPRIELRGQKFGRLTVRCFYRMRRMGGRMRAVWRCDCSCERKAQVFITGDRLRSGKTNSCGCLRSEIGKATIKRAEKARLAKCYANRMSWAEVAEVMG